MHAASPAAPSETTPLTRRIPSASQASARSPRPAAANADAVAGLLNYMTGESLFAAALPRACQECRGPLLAQHPGLADIDVPDFHRSLDAVRTWLAAQIRRFGETLPVAPLHPGDHTRMDPVADLRRINPGAAIITVPAEE